MFLLEVVVNCNSAAILQGKCLRSGPISRKRAASPETVLIFQMRRSEVDSLHLFFEIFAATIVEKSSITHFALAIAWVEVFQGQLISSDLFHKGRSAHVDVER